LKSFDRLVRLSGGAELCSGDPADTVVFGAHSNRLLMFCSYFTPTSAVIAGWLALDPVGGYDSDGAWIDKRFFEHGLSEDNLKDYTERVINA